MFFTYQVWSCERLSLGVVKELIGEMDVENKAVNYLKSIKDDTIGTSWGTHRTNIYKSGYNQALEDNKEKKYTEGDMKEVYEFGLMNKYKSLEVNNDNFRYYLSLQPKTEWEVELVDGKLKLK